MHILLANFTKMVNDSGGLAKVTCAFANEMLKRGHKVSLLYSDEKEGDFFYPINGSAALYNLKKKENGSIIKVPFYIKVLRESLRCIGKRPARTVNSWFEEHNLVVNLQYYLNKINPDIIVSYQPAASKLLLCDVQTKIPVITMSHGDPEDYFHIYPVKEIPALEKSAVCQVLMPSFEEHIKNHLPNAKTVVIGNAIPQFDFSADLDAEKQKYKIIFVGRLSKNHKRPHLILEAFKNLADTFPDWIVEIWGAVDNKTYYMELKNFIKLHGLTDKVFFKGTTDKVPQVLKEADIFAFPSAYEGFGMALAEGMSVGLPVVGFKNCPAVNELIKDGKTGILCDDGVAAFTQALKQLMENKDLRVKMGKAAKLDIQQYAPTKIWDKWESLLGKYSNK
jgi:glycosyltransferase involved in cell wall biosynthesis